MSPLLMESFLQLSQTIVESKDLNPKECRIWKSFFEMPAGKRGPAQLQVLRDRLKPFLRRAFRRPVEEKMLSRYVIFAAKQLKSGTSFTDTMKMLIGATIASPDFLYLYDGHSGASRFPVRSTRSKTGKAHRQKLDDFELASRLSFFFWGSIPDDTLLDLAQAKKLSDPKVFDAQLDRMLNDRRLKRFCDSFPGQWLQLDRLITSLPDKKTFPYFYKMGDIGKSYRASMHMLPEPLLLFESLVVENRSIMELIDPKFTYQSDLLTALYQGHAKSRKSVDILNFKRKPVTDTRFSGVITSAAVMTMTSSPKRTQPVGRGAWVNTVIFNDPPEPPPADVPPLPEVDEAHFDSLTIRQRFAEHREREDCAGCHTQIDPLGFALENFGPTGVWRDKYKNGRKVDPSGELFGKQKFDTFPEFKQLILKEKRRFIRAFVSHLMSFGLGRGLTAADSPALDSITDEAVAGDDKMRDILKKIARSDPFRHKNTSAATSKASEHGK